MFDTTTKGFYAFLPVDSDVVMTTATDEKVLRYEAFLNDQLKPDLKAILEKRDKVYEEIAEFLALKNSIGAIRAADLREAIQ